MARQRRRRRRIYATDRERAIGQTIEQDRAVQLAQQGILRISRQMERGIIAATSRNRDYRPILRRGMEQLTELLLALSVYGSLKGVESSAETARSQKGTARTEGTTIRLQSELLDRGLRFLRNRLNLPETTLDAIAQTYLPEILQVIANTSRDIQQTMGEAVADVFEEQLSRRDATARLREAWNATGMSAANPFTLETLTRTQTQLAYSAGARSFESDPVIDRILWGYKYMTVGDTRVRPTHAAMDGVTLPKDDPWWDANMPPNGFNCRCQAIALYDERVVVEPPETTVDNSGNIVVVEADEGFDFNTKNLPGVA